MLPFMRGQLIPIDGGSGPIRFQWNPREITGPTAKADYAILKCAGGIQPFLQFACRDVPETHFELIFTGERLDDSSVIDRVEALQRLTEPTVRGQGIARPPRVKFIMGNFPRQTCVVVEAQPVYSQMHGPMSLAPLYARVSVGLWRVRDDQ